MKIHEGGSNGTVATLWVDVVPTMNDRSNGGKQFVDIFLNLKKTAGRETSVVDLDSAKRFSIGHTIVGSIKDG